jgi:hypothetical protein
MNEHVEGLAEEIRIANEQVGQFQDAQMATNATLAEMQQAQAAHATSLATLTTCLDELVQQLADQRVEFDYGGDTEIDDQDHHGGCHRNRRGERVVHHLNDSFTKIKFMIPSFNGKYDPGAYLDWELAVDQKFHCHDVPAQSQVRAATSEFTDFASIWWREHRSKHPNNIPTTWEQLKTVMRHRFVPSYYARDLLNKMLRFQQGTKSVEEYYQELQTGMIRCGETNDAAMARFRGGLNREI